MTSKGEAYPNILEQKRKRADVKDDSSAENHLRRRHINPEIQQLVAVLVSEVQD